MNNFTNFTNETLGTIRTLENNGTTWFVAKDVCSIITSVPVASVLKRVSEDNKDRLNLGLGGNYTNVVNEDGLFQILDGGQTEKARILKEWIMSEVLPLLEDEEEYTIVEEEVVNDEEAVPFEEDDIPFDEVTVDSTPTSDSCVSNDESKNNFTIFSNAEFGNVRTIMINDKPYFMANDIARALGYAKPNNAILTHCRATLKRGTPISGKIQEVNFIPEGDVYRLIVKSKLPSAEKFESWVMDEVLPTIRKHGAYMTDSIIEKTLADPDYLIQLLTTLKEERQAKLQAEEFQRIAERKLEEQKPLVTFATHVTKTSDTVDMGEFAKIVAKEKINVGRNRLFTWLRDQGYLMANNVPYQRYINNGYFKVIEVSKVTSYGKINVFPKTLVTGKGQIYLVERLREEFGMVA